MVLSLTKHPHFRYADTMNYMNQQIRTFYMHVSRYQAAVAFTALLLSVVITGCFASEQITTTDTIITDPKVQESVPTSGPSWTETNLTDVVTGERFNIRQLLATGKPVIIHTFAVWCSGCSMQLQESSKLMAEHPDEYIVVGLDIDPNEDTATVKRHVEKNRFAGYYANAPSEMTKVLIGAYSPNFVLEIPQTVIACENGANRLGSGVFDAGTLTKAASSLCV